MSSPDESIIISRININKSLLPFSYVLDILARYKNIVKSSLRRVNYLFPSIFRGFSDSKKK